MILPNLALIGNAGAGKNTIADILTSDYGYEQYGFADALRDFVEATDERYAAAITYYGYEQAKRTDPYVRDKLKKVGKTARDLIHPDIWIYSLLDRLPPAGPVVVTDVRYENEVDALVDEGFEFITVTRPDYRDSGVELDLPARPSSYQIINDGDLVDLFDKVHEVVTQAAAFDVRV